MDRRTDRRTYRFAISISRVSMLTRDKLRTGCCVTDSVLRANNYDEQKRRILREQRRFVDLE